MQKEKFRIDIDGDITLDVEIIDGSYSKAIDFVPTSVDTDWVASSLYYGDEIVMEWVAYGDIHVHDEALASRWFRETYPDDADWYAPADKFREVAPDPEAAYIDLRREAEKSALREWLSDNDITVYRDDLRDFANEFALIFVLPGAEYTPRSGGYKVEHKDAVRYYFSYPDGVTEDYSCTIIID